MALFDEESGRYLCECGCGTEIPCYNRYVHNHHMRGKSLSEEHKQAISKSNKGREVSVETRQLLSEVCSGWHHSDRAKRLISEAGEGRKVSDETRQLISDSETGKEVSEETKRILSEAGRKNWRDPNYVRKVLEGLNAKPNHLEIFLGELLEEEFPGEWKYTGDGKLGSDSVVGGKLPDFTHVSKKLIIESFGSYYHSLNPANPRSEEGTIARYEECGYKCFVIWANDETEMLVNFSDLVEKLLGEAL